MTCPGDQTRCGRLFWEEAPGVVVAVESDALDPDELTDAAGSLRPATDDERDVIRREPLVSGKWATYDPESDPDAAPTPT